MTEPTGPGDLLPPASVEDVFAAAEAVRQSDFPEVPGPLLAAVLAAERDNLDNRTAAARAVDQVVENYLTSNPVTGQEESPQ